MTNATNTHYLHGHSERADGTKDSFWTAEVQAKDAPMRHHLAGLSWTATGYGKAIPSRTMVKFNGRWRRVYVCIFSNSGTAYIKAPAGQIILVKEY